MVKYKILSSWNIRKNKGQYISFGIIILLASLVLNLGLLVNTNFSKSFDEKWEESNSSEVFAVVARDTYHEEMANEIGKLDGVIDTDTKDGFYFTGSTWYEGIENALPSIYLPIKESKMNQVTILEQSEDITEQSIFVSEFLKYNGCQLGDELVLKSTNYEYSFQVAGFVEDMVFGTNVLSLMGFYLPEEAYQKFSKQADGLCPVTVIGLDTHLDSNKDLSNQVSNYLQEKGSIPLKTGYLENCRHLRTVTAQICAKIFIAFAFLMLLVCIMVSNFRINNNLNEELQNMGVLKSLGYTGRQMLLFIIGPYIVISLLLSIIGSALSYLVLPVMVDSFAMQTGFQWSQGFDLPILLLTAGILTMIISIACYVCASKIKRLHPIVALRGGIATHNFRRNHFELEKGKKPVNLMLSLKNLISNGKQNILLGLVGMVVTIAMIFAGVMYFNMAVDSKGFIYAIVETMPSSQFTVSNDCDHAKLLQEVKEIDEVNNAYYFDSISVMVEGEDAKAFIAGDFTTLDNDFCYEGRNPLHANELTLGNAIADNLGVSIGERVTVKNGDFAAKFYVTGFIQSVNESGCCIGLTKEGFLSIAPDYEESLLCICLEEENAETAKALIEHMEATYGATITSSVNTFDILDNSMHQFTTIAAVFSILILFITTILVAIILYMIIKTVITRKKVDLGILKAIGYTTRQLKLQMALSLAPVVFIGAVLGGIFSMFFMNKAIGALFQVLGIMKLNFFVPVLLISGVVIMIAILAFFLALALSGRIRKISAYSLIKE